MDNLLEEFNNLLKEDNRLVVDGKLLKNKVIELGLQLDPFLIKMLLQNPNIKKIFFQDAGGILIFDKVKFQKFVSNKSFLPDSYTSFKNKIGLTSGDEYLSERREVVLAWPFKDCVLEGGQVKEDEKRKEIFWNEILASEQIDRLLDKKVLTNFKKFTKDGELKVDAFSFNDNWVIKGNNLLVLHSLKYLYVNRIKLIYIDPPFNTGNDSFKYNDSFKHSTWLTFMKNRLDVAKELLSDDGIICIHIGNEELGYLRVLMDEIFGGDCFINHVTTTTNDPSGFKATSAGIFSTSNHLLIYGRKPNVPIKKLYLPKGFDFAYKYYLLNKEDNHSKWKYISINEALADSLHIDKNELRKKYGKYQLDQLVSGFADENKDKVFRTAAISGGALIKRRKTIDKSKINPGIVMQHPNEDVEGFYILNGEQIIFWENTYKTIDGENLPAKSLTDVWTDISWTGIAPEGGVILKNGKKPELLIKRIIELSTEEGDLVLDYHVGSGTTCAVAMKMNRRFIGIEQMEYEDNDSIQRLINVINGDTSGISRLVKWKGGSSFTSCELQCLNAKFLKDINQATSHIEIDLIFKSIISKGYINYKLSMMSKQDIFDGFSELSSSDKKKFLIEILDKNLLYLNYSEIDDEDYEVRDSDKLLNRAFYSLR